MICIDANIGAGKTTILQRLHNNHKYLICLEPVDQWMPYLKNIYENDKGYYEFQVKVWSDRSFIQDKTDKPILYERSPYFTKNTFVKCMLETGKITKEEYNNLNVMYDNTTIMWKPKKYIYVKVSPEVSYERIQKRNREYENNITLEYLKILYRLYEETYKEAKNKGMDIIEIDGERTEEEIVNEILRNIE